LAPIDQHPAPLPPATPVPDGEPSGLPLPQGCDAIFTASEYWAPVGPVALAPAARGRLNADVALPPAALITSEGAEQAPSLLAAAGLVLGLAGWWSAPGPLEDEEVRHRSY
jgi:hypothetical protein